MSRWHSVSENCSLSVTARFQIQDKRLRCLFNIAKWTWRPGFSCIPQFLPACYRALLVGTPHPLPLILPLTQGLGCPSSSCPSLYNPAILVTFSSLGSPGQCTQFPSPIISLLTWLRAMSTLVSSGCSCISMLPFIYNKLSPSPYLAAVVSSLSPSLPLSFSNNSY